MIPEYHPYILPYNTKPGLYKLGHDFGNGEYDKSPFIRDDNYTEYINAKSKINHNPIVIDNKYRDETSSIINGENIETLGFYEPVQEDYTIHKIENGSDKLIYTNVCMPSLWRPEESLGKSLSEFHEPVPNIVFPQKLINSLVVGRYVRFVWSVFHNQRLNQHPDLPLETFDPHNPIWHIRVERQVTIGFPEINCFLFVIKPYIVQNPKIPELIKTIDGMTEEHRKYKRISPEFREFLGKL